MDEAKPYDQDEVKKLVLRLRSQPASALFVALEKDGQAKQVAEMDAARLAATLDQLQQDNSRLRRKVGDQATNLMQVHRAHAALKNNLRKVAQGDAKIEIVLPPDTRPLEVAAE